MKIRKLLIANRGEIALRIMRSAKTLGIDCGVIYSSSEKNDLFVQKADHAFDIGTGYLRETYLNIPKIIELAKNHGFDAIHPGYGFLSENAEFSQACVDTNIVFIGPKPEQISLMSHKVEARNFVKSLGVPLLPSVSGSTVSELIQQAASLPFPLLVKAAAGGGGKAMKIVNSLSELPTTIDVAQREALSYFGNEQVYLEHYIEEPRHIEVQVMADSHGNVVHIFDRECSIQRRHQKIIEEAPVISLPDEVRNEMIRTALDITRSMNYLGAGTMEYLVDAQHKFYFLEMNTRIQVEHAVTEEITGLDLIREQILIAEGKTLSFKQSDVVCQGHAIECRIYAEDPFQKFMPSGGALKFYKEPVSVRLRIDSSMNSAVEISSDFDPMISKVIVHDFDRESAIQKLKDVLGNYILHGIVTNIGYLQEVLSHPTFIKNQVSTSFCEKYGKELTRTYQSKIHHLQLQSVFAAGIFNQLNNVIVSKSNETVWTNIGYWRNLIDLEYKISDLSFLIRFQYLNDHLISLRINQEDEKVIQVNRNGSLYTTISEDATEEIYITESENGFWTTVSGITFFAERTDLVELEKRKDYSDSSIFTGNEVVAPLFGKILKVKVQKGDHVQKGDLLLIIESMKMENNILASKNGIVSNILVKEGVRVSGSELLLTLTEPELN